MTVCALQPTFRLQHLKHQKQLSKNIQLVEIFKNTKPVQFYVGLICLKLTCYFNIKDRSMTCTLRSLFSTCSHVIRKSAAIIKQMLKHLTLPQDI